VRASLGTRGPVGKPRSSGASWRLRGKDSNLFGERDRGQCDLGERRKLLLDEALEPARRGSLVGLELFVRSAHAVGF
jgi:hypothetical protein